jgi:hypothetical protein
MPHCVPGEECGKQPEPMTLLPRVKELWETPVLSVLSPVAKSALVERLRTGPRLLLPSASPAQGLLDLAKTLQGYLKKNPPDHVVGQRLEGSLWLAQFDPVTCMECHLWSGAG